VIVRRGAIVDGGKLESHFRPVVRRIELDRRVGAIDDPLDQPEAESAAVEQLRLGAFIEDGDLLVRDTGTVIDDPQPGSTAVLERDPDVRIVVVAVPGGVLDDVLERRLEPVVEPYLAFFGNVDLDRDVRMLRSNGVDDRVEDSTQIVQFRFGVAVDDLLDVT